MDQIQRTLIKAGRKDLAQKYFHKVKGAKVSDYKLSETGLSEQALKKILKETDNVDKQILKEMKHPVDLRKYDLIRRHLNYLEKMGDMIQKGTV